MAFEDGQIYGTGNDATVNENVNNTTTQMNSYYYDKAALIELVKEQYFGQMADVTSMPKHFGKKIKKYHYLPMLDDRNLNDQGIDAAGVVIDTANYDVILPRADVGPRNTEANGTTGVTVNTYAVGEYFWSVADSTFYEVTVAIAAGGTITAGTNVTALNDAAVKALIETDISVYAYGDGTGEVTATVVDDAINVDRTVLTYATQAAAEKIVNLIGGTYSAQRSGNLYGSSKDPGLITAKMPALSETGGRVNRVGNKRIELEGSIEKFGFFDEYTQESLDFDSDSELRMHMTRELTRAANEITEDALQIDLLNGAGVIRYGGAAASMATVDENSELDYADLSALNITLDDNRCPTNTKLITGSRMIDTKTVDSARYAYIGSALKPTLEAMVDYHNNQAFIPVRQYGHAGTLARGEIGSVGQFRFIQVPEMMHYPGAGAVADDATFRATAGRYDVFPVLTVGSGSFTTIGFQTDGKTVKFKINSKTPGENVDRNDPYGETGFWSIKWYYGSMILRPEWIGKILVSAKI